MSAPLHSTGSAGGSDQPSPLPRGFRSPTWKIAVRCGGRPSGPPTHAAPWSRLAAGVLLALLPGCRSAPQRCDQPGSAAGDGPAWQVIFVRRAEDRIAADMTHGLLTLTVVSPSGIGSAELAHCGGRWPRQLRVRLFYAPERPFSRLEGLEVALGDTCPVTLAKGGAPAGCRSDGTCLWVVLPARRPAEATLHLSWVDAYR